MASNPREFLVVEEAVAGPEGPKLIQNPVIKETIESSICGSGTSFSQRSSHIKVEPEVIPLATTLNSYDFDCGRNVKIEPELISPPTIPSISSQCSDIKIKNEIPDSEEYETSYKSNDNNCELSDIQCDTDYILKCEVEETTISSGLRSSQAVSHYNEARLDCKPQNNLELVETTTAVINSDDRNNIPSETFEHQLERPAKCFDCNKSFPTRNHLLEHRDSVHFNLKSHKYSSCDKSFSMKSRLARHQNFVHDKFTPFRCPHCEKSFAFKSQVSDHQTAVHDNFKPHKCTLCEQSFALKGQVKRHQKTIHGKRK